MVTFDGKKARKVKRDLPSSRNKPFFITTAIDYPSSKPHLGHAYEKICADTIARFQRLIGKDVYFSTGTDEHGLKIQRAAGKAGKTPKEFVDEMVVYFKELCRVLNISYNDFIRTTEKRHIRVAQDIFRLLHKKGLIYKGEYEGLYCVDCESFYLRKDLAEDRCPVHKKPPETIREESYFFRMGKFQKELKNALKKGLVEPEGKGLEILNRLKEDLKDLSVSRSSIAWGIPVPIDKKHTQYVWLDALLNYISTLGWPSGKFRRYWPADIHLIGKDIVWHHSVIWGSILMGSGIPLPRKVFVHGFVNLSGQKLSKARGIIVDPIGLCRKYGTDSLRYFLLREIPFGEDGDFSEDALVTRNNDELADTLGNLVHRILSFIYSKNKGTVPKPGKYDKLDKKLKLKIETTMERAGTLLEDLQLHKALEEILGLAKAGNEYFQAKEPWKGDFDNCLYLGANLVRSLAILLSPYIPESSRKILKSLNTKLGSWESARKLLVKPGHKIRKPEPLFRKLELEEAPQERKKIKVGVEKGCQDLGIKARAALLYGLKVKKKKGSLEKLKKEQLKGMRINQKRIGDYLGIYKKLGLKGTGHPIPKMYKIIKNTGKLPTINTVVDSYNLVAVRESLSVGAHDLDRIEGNIRFKVTDGSEKYTPLGGSEPKKIRKGEYACTDSKGKRIICRLDIKQCEGTRITPSTRNVFLYVQGNRKTPDSLLKKALKEICENITKFCGGECMVL